MPLIYEFELDAEERKRVQDIQADLFEKMLNGDLHIDEGWNRHMTAYGDEMIDIYEKGRERTLKHYSEKPGSLYKALEAEVKNYVAIVYSIEKSRANGGRKPLNMDKWRKDFEKRIAPYMEILKGESQPEESPLSGNNQKIVDYLELHAGDSYTPAEITKKLELNKNTVLSGLNRLNKKGIIKKNVYGGYYMPKEPDTPEEPKE